MRHRRLVPVVIAFGWSVAAACYRSNGSSDGIDGDAPATSARDSVQGIVAVTGVDALPQVTLRLESGGPSITLTGASSLMSVAGLRVAVIGLRDGRRLAVQRFVVVSANGIAATDGVLSTDGDAVVLVSADGSRHTLVDPSPRLRAAIGRRAWVSGPLTQAPVAYGIIE